MRHRVRLCLRRLLSRLLLLQKVRLILLRGLRILYIRIALRNQWRATTHSSRTIVFLFFFGGVHRAVNAVGWAISFGCVQAGL